VKLLAEHLAASPDSRARFEAETAAVARLQSEEIVKLYDHGVERGTPFMVMELLEGESLAQRIDARGRLDVAEVVAMALQICRGLAAAHAQGIVHRDVKPSNIFLARARASAETAKLLDFGIAKLVDPSAPALTESGHLVGSIPYVSPEQVRCERDIDQRTDVWSLGATLYEALVGRPPFGRDAMALMRIAHDTFARPSTVTPGLPIAFDAFFERALARDRDARFASVEDLARALASTSSGLEARAAPARPATPTRTAPSARRWATQRASIAVGIAGIAALLAAAALGRASVPPPATRTGLGAAVRALDRHHLAIRCSRASASLELAGESLPVAAARCERLRR
jgi:serine/threonine-protein kinase